MTYCLVFSPPGMVVCLALPTKLLGHNADDIAETVIMNILRGDVARLQRCTAIATGDGSEGAIARFGFHLFFVKYCEPSFGIQQT